MNVFERATRMKYRYATSIGDLTTEQLWDLPLISRGDRPDLDKIARAIHLELKGLDEVSFVNVKPDPRRNELEFKLQILKDIIAAKTDEAAAVTKRAEIAQRKEKLLAALAQKEDAELQGMSREELKAEIEKLGA